MPIQLKILLLIATQRILHDNFIIYIFLLSSQLGTEQQVNILMITIHTEVSNFQNAIAILHLSEEAKFSDHIQPICLPTEDEIVNNENMECIFSGKFFLYYFFVIKRRGYQGFARILIFPL